MTVVGYLQQGATNPRGWRLRTKSTSHTGTKLTQILCYLSDIRSLYCILLFTYLFFTAFTHSERAPLARTTTGTAGTGWRGVWVAFRTAAESVSVSQNNAHSHTYRANRRQTLTLLLVFSTVQTRLPDTTTPMYLYPYLSISESGGAFVWEIWWDF